MTALDAPEAQRRARSQAWLDARAYWYPARLRPRMRRPGIAEAEGHRYTVINGDAGLAAIQSRCGSAPAPACWSAEQKRASTAPPRSTPTGWREVDGLRPPFLHDQLPHRCGGRTDARNRSETSATHIALDAGAGGRRLRHAGHDGERAHPRPGGVARVPFELVNNHIYAGVPSTAGGGALPVDTGGMNLLTPAAAAKFGPAPEGKAAGSRRRRRGNGGRGHGARARGAWGEAVPTSRRSSSWIWASCRRWRGYASDGLVERDVPPLGVTIDDARHELLLAEPAKFTLPAGAHAVPFELAERIPIVGQPRRRAGASASMTPARASLSVHAPFAREHGPVAKYAAAPERGRLGRRRAGARSPGTPGHAAARRLAIEGHRRRHLHRRQGARSPVRTCRRTSAAACCVASPWPSTTRPAHRCTSRPTPTPAAPTPSDRKADCGCSPPRTAWTWSTWRRTAPPSAPACGRATRITAMDGRAP